MSVNSDKDKGMKRSEAIPWRVLVTLNFFGSTFERLDID